MSDSFLDKDVPRFTWRTVILWGSLSPFAMLALFFIVGADGAAAWVQAVGSVGAIIAAIWISRMESERSRDDRLMDSYLYLEKAFSVAAYAIEAVKGAAGYILQGQPTVQMLEYHVSLLDITSADLDEIDFVRLDSQMTAGAFLAIKRAVNLTRSTILMRLRTSSDFDGMQVLSWRQNVDREIELMKQGIRNFLIQHPQVLDKITFPRF